MEGPFQADPTGPTFHQALKEQLGLKFESVKAPVHVFVIDSIEGLVTLILAGKSLPSALPASRERRWFHPTAAGNWTYVFALD